MSDAKRTICPVCKCEFAPRTPKQDTCSLDCEYRHPRHRTGTGLKIAYRRKYNREYHRERTEKMREAKKAATRLERVLQMPPAMIE